jgi:hypothetical protein
MNDEMTDEFVLDEEIRILNLDTYTWRTVM